MSDSYSLELPNGFNHSYKVNPSKRAKYIRIKLSSKGDLSVTLPYKSSIQLAHQFINSKSAWIEKHLSNLTAQSHQIPNEINLKLLGERWLVTCVLQNNKEEVLPKLKVDKASSLLLFSGGDEHLAIFQAQLERWLKIKAKEVFTNMLEHLAVKHGFHYKKLSIRAQKTRWGSCSSSKNISLNCKLLFLPEEVVNYVMIHELCHTIQMNHSENFWALVEDCDAEFKLHRKALKQFKGL